MFAQRPCKRTALPEMPDGKLQDLIETPKAHICSKVEHPFRVIKQQFGFQKTRLRGLAKNRCKIHMLAGSRVESVPRASTSCSSKADQTLNVPIRLNSSHRSSHKWLDWSQIDPTKVASMPEHWFKRRCSLPQELRPRLPRVSLTGDGAATGSQAEGIQRKSQVVDSQAMT